MALTASVVIQSHCVTPTKLNLSSTIATVTDCKTLFSFKILNDLSIPSNCRLCDVSVLLQIKQKENDMALKYYQKAVKSLEALSWEERQFALVTGVLAGNVFDWGAKAVSE